MNLSAGWLLAVAAAAQAPAEPQVRQAVQAVDVVARGEPMAERRVERVNAFYSQHLLTESGIVFDIPPAEFEELRDRYDLRRIVPFVLSEWLELRAAPGGAAELRHLGFLHCSARVTWGTTNTCFRDADGDGRLDSVAVYQVYDFPEEGLQFRPIEPVPYHYVQQPRVPVEVRRGTYAGPSLGIAWNYEGGNRESGRLNFYAQYNAPTLGSNLRANIDPPATVDVSRLPATLEIAGAQITVLAWDGRRPTVRVDRPFPTTPVRLVASRDSVRLLLGGSERHWRLQPIDAPLPGEPASE